ncbi:hypothetical protein WBK31_02175 [Nonomuraea sp. N2-4H]
MTHSERVDGQVERHGSDDPVDAGQRLPLVAVATDTSCPASRCTRTRSAT